MEDVYSAFRTLSSIKPTVAVIEGIAASGGYYVSVAAQHIIAEPTSFVGNVGVIGFAPPIVIPSELIVETGPYKLMGFDIREFPLLIRRALENFLKAVEEGRGSKLKISLKELSKGKLYIGTDAVKLGLVDEIGGLTDAIAYIAEKCKIKKFLLVDITSIVYKKFKEEGIPGITGFKLWSERRKVTLSLLENLTGSRIGIYYLSPLYIKDDLKGLFDIYPKVVFKSKVPGFKANKTGVKRKINRVIAVDMSHRNLFTPAIFNTLFGEFVRKGFRIAYITDKSEFKAAISSNPACVMIFTPLEVYSSEEVEAIRRYVVNGGVVLLVYEPSLYYSYPINTIAEGFGIHFIDGYVYSLENCYGIYRNIIVNVKGESNLTRRVSTLVFFTAGNISCSKSLEVIGVDNVTSIITGGKGHATLMAVNGSVIAISDMSIISDIYSTLYDNGKFILNLANFIISKIMARVGGK